MPIPLDMNGIT